MEAIEVSVGSKIVTLSGEALEALIPLTPGCCGKNPIPKSAWEREPPERLWMWAQGIIDERGNLTRFGKRLWQAIQQDWENTLQRAIDEFEMDELDALDRACRRRPRSRRYDG